MKSSTTNSCLVTSIRNRLNDRNQSGHQHINKFSTLLINAISKNINGNNRIITKILTYSNHQQIINQWHAICDKLGPFAYLINSSCSVNDIKLFEKQLVQNSTKHITLPKQLPSNIRVSLMICECIQIPIFFESMCNIENAEYLLAPLCFWAFCSEWDWNEVYSQMSYNGNSDFFPSVPEHLTYLEMDEYDDNLKKAMVFVGWKECGESGSYAIWNTLNDKLVYGSSHRECYDLSEEVTNVEDFILNNCDNYCEMDYIDWCKLDRKCFKNMKNFKKYLLKKQYVISRDSNEDSECLDVFCDFVVSKIYEKRYEPLVNGYIRQNEKCLVNFSVPAISINIIVLYFPFFLKNKIH